MSILQKLYMGLVLTKLHKNLSLCDTLLQVEQILFVKIQNGPALDTLVVDYCV